jgi:hypothetical protein
LPKFEYDEVAGSCLAVMDLASLQQLNTQGKDLLEDTYITDLFKVIYIIFIHNSTDDEKFEKLSRADLFETTVGFLEQNWDDFGIHFVVSNPRSGQVERHW